MTSSTAASLHGEPSTANKILIIILTLTKHKWAQPSPLESVQGVPILSGATNAAAFVVNSLSRWGNFRRPSQLAPLSVTNRALVLYEIESSRHICSREQTVSMKPFPNRTGIFQRIRLSIASELSPGFGETFSFLKSTPLPGSNATVVLRLVNGATVSLDGHNAIDYYDHSASNRN